jgi:predicted NUDIX family NTP pyrophosphohydrolase
VFSIGYMLKDSAGLLMYKISNGELMVFIVHPGGPFWKDKDEGAWSIPKGEVDEGEELLSAAMREVKEETGLEAKEPFIELGSVMQASGKIVYCWAFEGDWTGLLMGSSYVRMEWPLGSGKTISFPEVDKAGFFTLEEARRKLNPAQADFLDRLREKISSK